MNNPTIIANVGKTIHQGLEFASTFYLVENLLSFDVVYSYNDFRFDDHGEYGDNRLSSTPDHTLSTWFDIRPMKGFLIQPKLRYVSGQTVTYDNSGGSLYQVPSYRLYDLKVSYRIDNWLIFLDVENVTDEDYIADARSILTTNTVAPSEIDQGPNVVPGRGRASVLGFEYKFLILNNFSNTLMFNYV